MAPNQGKQVRLLEELRFWCFSPEAISSPGSSLVLGGAAASLPHPAAPQTLQNAIWHRASSGGEAKPQLAGGAGVRGAGEAKRGIIPRLPHSVRGVGKARTDAGGERASIRIG